MSGFTFPEERASPRFLDAHRTVGERVLTLRAENVQRERTGVHAHVALAVGTTVVHDDVFNVSREDERHKFANRLYGTRQTPGKFKEDITQAYEQETFEHEFMLWSRALWLQWVGNDEGEFVGGDPEYSPPSFVMRDYVIHGGGTVLFGSPKAGKSFMALLWAVAVDSGVNGYWHIDRPARVLFINLERGKGEITRRLGMVNRVLGLPPDRPLLMINRRGKTLADVYDAAARTVEKQGVEMTFLDSLTRGGFGNLNGNEEANKAMDYLNGLSPSWCAIGHTPYGDDTKLFGSQMFRAAYDVGVNVRAEYLKRPDGTEDRTVKGIGLYVRDANDIMPADPAVWVYEFDREMGLQRLRAAQRHEFPELEAEGSSPRTNRQRVLDHLTAFGPISITQIATDTGINKGTVSTEVASLVSAGDAVLVGKEGRNQLYNAAVNVMVEGQR